MAETGSDGVKLTRFYIYLAGQVVGFVDNNQLYYVHNDNLTRAEVITNQSKTVVWRAINQPFGGRRLTVANIEYNLGLPGMYFTPGTGLWYNWHRWYDEELGIYLQSDPIGLNGGINTYVYANNNPIMFIDPTGLDYKIEEIGIHSVIQVDNPERQGTVLSIELGPRSDVSKLDVVLAGITGDSVPGRVEISFGTMPGAITVKTVQQSAVRDQALIDLARLYQKQYASGTKKYNPFGTGGKNTQNCHGFVLGLAN